MRRIVHARYSFHGHVAIVALFTTRVLNIKKRSNVKNIFFWRTAETTKRSRDKRRSTPQDFFKYISILSIFAIQLIHSIPYPIFPNYVHFLKYICTKSFDDANHPPDQNVVFFFNFWSKGDCPQTIDTEKKIY